MTHGAQTEKALNVPHHISIEESLAGARRRLSLKQGHVPGYDQGQGQMLNLEASGSENEHDDTYTQNTEPIKQDKRSMHTSDFSHYD